MRIRSELILYFLRTQAPDILCLQELKATEEQFVSKDFESLGYIHNVVRGQKAYNGVAILSKIPLGFSQSLDLLGNGDARHIAAELANGVIIDNFYVPAGGYEPNREINPKFGDKLDYVAAMRDWSRNLNFRRRILVGDLNIAPLEDDVWSHKQLLNVVSHTPEEVSLLLSVLNHGDWCDIVRHDISEGKLYSWWSYRSPNWDAADKGRRLDHIWASSDLVRDDHHSCILRAARGWQRPSDHVPVMAHFEI